MSGGSQHNPNGRQSQMGPSWSPLQLQMANLLARAPQAHMASERGVTWHTPTPPPHLYHVPAPSPPDPLQAMKNAGNSVFRHTATPPELYRHTPTPPDKHHMRHTPSPGDVKGGSALPPSELYAHMGSGRDKLRPDELLSYARVGVDLSVGSRSTSNGSANALSIREVPNNTSHRDGPSPSLSVRDTTSINSALTVRDATSINSALTVRDASTINSALTVRDASSINNSPSLSVRDAPTINSLIARAGPRPPHARVDALLERLVPSPVSPHSVIVHSRAAPTPSPPSSNEDSADSCGAVGGSKRKRKPERTVRLPALPPAPAATPPARAKEPRLENGDAHAPPQTPPPKDELQHQPEKPEPHPPPQETPPQPQEPQRPPTRRKSRSGSAETIDELAAMIASTTGQQPATEPPPAPETNPATIETIDELAAMIASTTGQQPTTEPPPTPEANPATIDNLISVLTSPEVKKPEPEPEVKKSPPKAEEKPIEAPPVETAAAPRRRSARTSNTEATNVPIESPSEAKPAEPETSEPRSVEPTAASFVDVEKQLENMCAGLEETNPVEEKQTKARKRRKSAPTKGDRKDRKASRRASRASEGSDSPRKKTQRKRSEAPRGKKDVPARDAYDSGSNASSSRSRGPYIQIRGPRDSPLSVSVMNAWTGEDETESGASRRKPHTEEFRNGLRARGLHVSTLGLRYDASTPDLTWLCAFCEKGPHAQSLGDLFGPYTVDEDCEQYRSLDEATRRRYSSSSEVWFHEACGVWAPGLVAAGSRLWGLSAAVWAARGARCAACCRPGAAVACAARGCRGRAHVPCARLAGWALCDHTFRATCPPHAHASRTH